MRSRGVAGQMIKHLLEGATFKLAATMLIQGWHKQMQF